MIGQLSFKEIWLYEGLLFEADDYGLFEARSKSLRRDITGEKEDEFTVEEVESFLQHASDLGLVILYEVEGRRYGWVQKFRQQVRAKRPLFPLPPGYVIRDKQMIADDNHMPTNDNHMHSTCITDDNHAIGKNKENDSVSELGQMYSKCIADDNHLPTDDKHLPANVHLDEDEDEDEDEVKDEDEAHPLSPHPCTVEEVEAHLRSAAFAGRVRLTPDQIPDCATAYWGSRDAVNWTRNGIPVTKWQSDAISFATSYALNHPPAPGNGGERDPFPDSSNLGSRY
ncbi:hypothetical protein PVA48_13370 [Akkermansia sp. JRP_AM1]|uniref:hypothetical protein n=1 Tax=Akkermansia sp. JRP_AM1 TaxID=3414159 RepID=UPI003BFA79C1